MQNTEYHLLIEEYNKALDDFAQALKRLMKQKKEKNETLTTKDIDETRRLLKYL